MLSTAAIRLLEPSFAWLPAYAEALRAGWSPNTLRDVCGEELAAITADPAEALRLICKTDGGRRMPDGTVRPWLPGCVLWIFDETFCGAINLRYQPGTQYLPPGVSGHLGYTLVPWKRGLGYAKEAVRQMLPIAARLTGLPRISAACSSDNAASRAVIEANGGVFDGVTADGSLLFQIDLPEPTGFA